MQHSRNQFWNRHGKITAGSIKSNNLPAVVALGVTAILAAALIPTGQTEAFGKPGDNKLTDVKELVVKAVSMPGKSASPARITASVKRRSLTFYTGDVRSGMFSEPVAPAPPLPPLPVPPKPVPPAPIDPYAEWSYTGSATIGDEKIAIVENINTHDGIMLHVGEEFLGAKVADIDGKFITLATGKDLKVLPVSMNTSFVPLSASAPYLTANPNPGGGIQMPGMGIMPGGGGVDPSMVNDVNRPKRIRGGGPRGDNLGGGSGIGGRRGGASGRSGGRGGNSAGATSTDL